MKSERKLKQVLVYLDTEVWRKLRALGNEEDRSASGILRQILKQGLPQYERQIGQRRDAAA